MRQFRNVLNVLGPVAQSIVSLTSSLVVKMLTVLVSSTSISKVILLKKKKKKKKKDLFLQMHIASAKY